MVCEQGDLWYNGCRRKGEERVDRYLTAKAERKRWWHIPIAAFSALLIAVSVEVWIEDKDVGDMAVYVLAHLTEMALVAWPLVYVIRHWLRKRDAGRIAKKLTGRRENALPLGTLDAVLGEKKAAEKIQRLTAKGYLQLASVDREAGVLWLNNPESAGEPEKAEPDGEFDGLIRRIRQLNDDIADEAVSRKIERIEAVTRSIFRTVREQPDRAEDARRFMNYYLPTTLRLLESYRLMEGQSYQGETIQTSRRRIEEVLEKLVHAIEQQQDKLFRSDAMDVEAEIRVLETMMASDGLTRTGMR